MKKLILIGLMIAAMGVALAAGGELMTPGGLPTPLGPEWKKLDPEECTAVWKAFKEEAKGAALSGLREPKEINCLYFDKRSKNMMLNWEMGNRTLSQVFLEGWEKVQRTFDVLRGSGRAKGIVTFQPTPKSFVALVLGFEELRFWPIFEVIYALERENDVVLIERER